MSATPDRKRSAGRRPVGPRRVADQRRARALPMPLLGQDLPRRQEQRRDQRPDDDTAQADQLDPAQRLTSTTKSGIPVSRPTRIGRRILSAMPITTTPEMITTSPCQIAVVASR